MKNGTMLSDLLIYKDTNFWERHPIISFYTEAEAAEYEIIAAFEDRVHYKNSKHVFRYYNYGGNLTEDDFNNYILNILNLTPYDTKLTAMESSLSHFPHVLIMRHMDDL